MPYDQSLGALLHEPNFQKLLPEAVFQKARVIHKVGNQAVHHQRPVRQFDALQVAQELHHVLYWLARNYSRHGAQMASLPWNLHAVPRPKRDENAVPRAKLVDLEADLAKKNAQAFERQQQIDALDKELQALREELTAIREANQAKADPHDYLETDTRKYIIDVELRRAGWLLEGPNDVEYKVTGMPVAGGDGYADYVLWGDDGLPLGVVEAKRTTGSAEKGRQQAKLYADCLEQMHGQRPVIFYTNGYTTWIWDDASYPPRKVAGFYTKGDLQRLVQRRAQRKPLDVALVNPEIAGRYYQRRAIGSLCAHFAKHQRKGLLVMATGTGKTRTAIALVDVLQRANWAKRVLFLADRISLVNQAANAFKLHLPDSSPVNLVTDKNTEGRVYVCTYPTMMGLIDQTSGDTANFSVGHFDLVIIDEAHRSVDDLVIQKLRRNEALTPKDLDELERILAEIGDDEGDQLLADLLKRSEAPSLPHFVRQLVGMDRAAAQAAFARFLEDRSLSPQQIRFVEMVIDQLTSRGVMGAAALYEPPFSDLHAGGPDAVFAEHQEVIEGIFETLRGTLPKVGKGA